MLIGFGERIKKKRNLVEAEAKYLEAHKEYFVTYNDKLDENENKYQRKKKPNDPEAQTEIIEEQETTKNKRSLKQLSKQMSLSERVPSKLKNYLSSQE